MSRLQELIRELCPDGVEYKALGEIGAFYGGLTGKSKNDFGSGAKFVTYNNVYGNPAIDLEEYGLVNVGPDERQNTVELGDVLFTISSENREEAGLTSVMTVDPGEAWYLNSFCTGWRLYDKSILLPDFLKHVLRGPEVREAISRTANGVTRFNISKPRLAKVRIPIPPIEVQREVVRILDEYMAAHDELVRQLEEEMALREQQFSIARVGLLEFGDDESVPMRSLADVATFGGGHTPSKAVADNYQENGIWWVTSKDVKADVLTSTGITISEQGASTLTMYPRGTLVMVTRSGILKRMLPVAYLDDDMTVNQDIKAIMPDASVILPKFLLYVLKKDDETIRERYGKVGGTVDSVNFNMVKKHLIPVPSIDMQTHIVETLDGLAESHYAMCLALSDELAYRDQQLALVRNQLLSFPEKVA